MPSIFISPDNSRERNYQQWENEVVTYTLKWKNFLGSDTISKSTWESESGLSTSSDSNDNDSATVNASGVKEGGKYYLTNKIVTANGNTYEHNIYILGRIKERTRNRYFS